MRRDPLAHPEELIQRVYAYCAYRLGEGADAEDAASDAIERALRYRESYDPRKGTPAAWLIGIARHCVEDVRVARLPVTDDELEVAAPTRDDASTLDLVDAVGHLDQRDRELIALRYGADLKPSDIATVLDMKPTAVRVAIHRALTRLRDELQPKADRVSPAPGRRFARTQ